MRDRLEVLDNDNLVIVHEATTDSLRASAAYAADVRNSGYNAAKGDMGKVASVPDYMVKRFCALKGIRWDEFMRNSGLMEEFLNSAEIAGFRTWAGSI